MPDNSATKELVRLRTGREIPELLRDLYVERRWTDHEISVELKVSRSTIVEWRQEYGISRADRTTAPIVAEPTA